MVGLKSVSFEDQYGTDLVLVRNPLCLVNLRASLLYSRSYQSADSADRSTLGLRYACLPRDRRGRIEADSCADRWILQSERRPSYSTWVTGRTATRWSAVALPA